VVDSVFHITSGGGGAALNDPKPDSERIVTYDKSYHFCKLEIDNDTLHFSAIRGDGTEIESFDYFIISSSTGIDPVSKMESEFKVYTKSNSIIIENNNAENATIMVFDIWGRKIRQEQLSANKQDITIQQRGIYFVRVKVKGLFFVKKVVVK
jgi:hypothetical protein